MLCRPRGRLRLDRRLGVGDVYVGKGVGGELVAAPRAKASTSSSAAASKPARRRGRAPSMGRRSSCLGRPARSRCRRRFAMRFATMRSSVTSSPRPSRGAAREHFGKDLRRLVRVTGGERHDDVQAVTAGRLDERLQPDRCRAMSRSAQCDRRERLQRARLRPGRDRR